MASKERDKVLKREVTIGEYRIERDNRKERERLIRKSDQGGPGLPFKILLLRVVIL